MLQNRLEILNEFYQSPPEALFDQKKISLVLECSGKSLERDRWAGTGIRFRKLGRSVRYQKSDVLAWLEAQAICGSILESQHD